MDDSDVRRLQDLLDEAEASRPVLAGLDDAVNGVFESAFLPPSGNSQVEREYRALMARSELPVCGLIVKAVVDRLSVEGVRSEVGPKLDVVVWDWWQRGRLDSRQSQLFSDSLTFGDGFLSVTLGADGVPLVVPESPLALFAREDRLDPFATVEAVKVIGDTAWVYDAESIQRFTRGSGIGQARRWVKAGEVPHPLGVCPIVRAPNELDSLGRSMSDLKVVLPFQKRLNQTVFTRLLLEAHQAWEQRWIAGIDVNKGPDGVPIPPFRMGVDQLLTAPDPDTKFGAFPSASTQDLLKAVEEDLRHLAVATQTPPTLFAVASVSNISQESLAALEGGLTRKVEAKQALLGEALEAAFRLAGRLVGVDVGDHLEMVWANMELRSLAQRSDAFVKLRSAGLPVSYLMESLLDMSPNTIDRVLAASVEEQSQAALAQAAAYGVAGVDPGAGEPVGA